MTELEDQRKRARQAFGRGRWWYLRGVFMVVAAVLAWRLGGQVYHFLSGVLVILAAMSMSLGHSIRRGAAAALQKIDLMEKTKS